MVHNPEDAYRKNDGEDSNRDENNHTHSEMERTQEDTRHGPKSNNKMQVDKTGEQHSERFRTCLDG